MLFMIVCQNEWFMADGPCVHTKITTYLPFANKKRAIKWYDHSSCFVGNFILFIPPPHLFTRWMNRTKLRQWNVHCTIHTLLASLPPRSIAKQKQKKSNNRVLCSVRFVFLLRFSRNTHTSQPSLFSASAPSCSEYNWIDRRQKQRKKKIKKKNCFLNCNRQQCVELILSKRWKHEMNEINRCHCYKHAA